VREDGDGSDARATRAVGPRGARAAAVARLLAAAALLLAAVATAHADAADVIARAREASAEGRRDEGIALLEAHLAEAPRDVDARLLYGLLLSWDARYDDARRELKRVLAQTPGYLDARIALMNVEWWSGNEEAALALAREILSRQAHHPQARLVEQRIGARQRPWTTTASHTHDWFDDERNPWSETSLAVGRETPLGPVLVRGSHLERFGLGDQLIELEAYPRFRAGTYAYLGFGAATHADLYPDWRLGFELYQSLPWGLEVSAGYRRLEFSDPVNIAVTSVSKYLGNWLLTERIYYVPAAGNADSTSYFSSLRRYFGEAGTSFVGLRYGRGAAREELRDLSDLVNVDSDSLTAEVDTELRRRVRLALAAGFSRQERAAQPALWQVTLTTTVGIRF
jgi:YaiO family outer membrane protein